MSEIPRNKQVFDNGKMMFAIRESRGIHFEFLFEEKLYTIITDHDENVLSPDISALRAATKKAVELVEIIK